MKKLFFLAFFLAFGVRSLGDVVISSKESFSEYVSNSELILFGVVSEVLVDKRYEKDKCFSYVYRLSVTEEVKGEGVNNILIALNLNTFEVEKDQKQFVFLKRVPKNLSLSCGELNSFNEKVYVFSSSPVGIFIDGEDGLYSESCHPYKRVLFYDEEDNCKYVLRRFSQKRYGESCRGLIGSKKEIVGAVKALLDQQDQ